MTDNQIENWVKKLSDLSNGYFLLEKQINTEKDLLEQSKILSDNLDIDYLEKEIGLVVRFLSENKNANIIKLSIKGNEVVNVGGWAKYKENKKNKKRYNKNKKEFSYWFGILLPFSMLLVAIWTSTNDNQNQLDTINKLHQDTIESIENEVDKRIETLTKKMDSVLLVNDTKTDGKN